MNYNILICDDDKDIVNAISIYLKAEGYQVLCAYNGQEALDILTRETVHLLLLDLMMPVMDGLTALSLIRKEHNLPVILLTAKSEDTDKVLGLNLGADDYITKPFNPVELLARVRSQLRRFIQLGGNAAGRGMTEGNLVIGGICLNDQAKEVFVDGEPCKLTKTEYDILKFLMEHPGQVFSPKEIYSTVWKEICLDNVGTVAVHIRRLREKIEINPSDPRYIKVVWGRGYMMSPQPGAAREKQNED